MTCPSPVAWSPDSTAVVFSTDAGSDPAAPSTVQTVRSDGADRKTLIEGLKSDNLLWRLHAQRLIVEGGKNELVPELTALVSDKKVDEIGLNPAAVHALWALDGLGAAVRGDSRAAAASASSLVHLSFHNSWIKPILWLKLRTKEGFLH
mgnify:CR=1 FL=1